MSGLIEVSAKSSKKPDVGIVSLEYNFGENLEEMRELFGDETVFTNARANMKVGLQGAMRRYIEKGQDVASLATAWKPGVQMERTVDPVAAIKSQFANWTDEQKAAFIAQLTEG